MLSQRMQQPCELTMLSPSAKLRSWFHVNYKEFTYRADSVRSTAMPRIYPVQSCFGFEQVAQASKLQRTAARAAPRPAQRTPCKSLLPLPAVSMACYAVQNCVPSYATLCIGNKTLPSCRPRAPSHPCPALSAPLPSAATAPHLRPH